MTKYLLSITTGLFMAFSLLVPQGVALAETPACDFGTKFEDLKTILASPGTNDQKKIVAELNIRKDLLKITVGCLENDSRGLKDALSKIKTTSPEVKAFDEWILRQIEENISYYGYKKTQIDNLGIKGAKDLAKELADRKEQVSDPIGSLVSTLVDWTNNQPLFETGAKRFSDIKRTIDAFKLPADHEVVLLETEAIEIFNEAAEENKSAWQDISTRQIESGRAKTKESLEQLAEAYTVFLKISEVSKKILPL